MDECSAEISPCDSNANCTNSDGSYSCTCKQGFTGDGRACEGNVLSSKDAKSHYNPFNHLYVLNDLHSFFIRHR